MELNKHPDEMLPRFNNFVGRIVKLVKPIVEKFDCILLGDIENIKKRSDKLFKVSESLYAELPVKAKYEIDYDELTEKIYLPNKSHTIEIVRSLSDQDDLEIRRYKPDEIVGKAIVSSKERYRLDNDGMLIFCIDSNNRSVDLSLQSTFTRNYEPNWSNASDAELGFIEYELSISLI